MFHLHRRNVVNMTFEFDIYEMVSLYKYRKKIYIFICVLAKILEIANTTLIIYRNRFWFIIWLPFLLKKIFYAKVFEAFLIIVLYL